jgi:hypothetical protein
MIEKIIDNRIEESKMRIIGLQAELAELADQKENSSKNSGIEKWLGFRFESSSGLTSEFAEFARDFKNHIKRSLPVGSELVNWSRGHFEVSGFVKRSNKFVYFSISDVRFWQDSWFDNILIRTAEHEKDWTGGSNQSTKLPEFTSRVENLL